MPEGVDLLALAGPREQLLEVLGHHVVCLLELLGAIEFVDVQRGLRGRSHSTRGQAVIGRTVGTDAADAGLLFGGELADVVDLLDVVLQQLDFVEHTYPALDHDALELNLGGIVHLLLLLFVNQSVPDERFE